LYASIAKLLGGYASVGILLTKSRLLPASWVPPLHACLPYAEILWGVFLISGVRRRTVLLVSTIVILVFMGVLSVAGYRTDWGAECGCAGLLNKTTVLQSLLRNAILLLMCVFGLILTKTPARNS